MAEWILTVKPLIVVVHFTVSIFLIIVILLQAGQGAEIGAAFGGSSQTVFGARGATSLLSKITAGAAVIFLMTSIYLTYVARSTSEIAPSVLDEVPSAPLPVHEGEDDAAGSAAGTGATSPAEDVPAAP